MTNQNFRAKCRMKCGTRYAMIVTLWRKLCESLFDKQSLE